MTARRVDPRHWATFAENASPEAINAHLTRAHTERRTLDRYITKLENLLDRRTTSHHTEEK